MQLSNRLKTEFRRIMPLVCWLYVSENLIPTLAVVDSVRDIVAKSQIRNAELSVTGSLILCRGRFAQFLEGPAEGVAEIRASIERDARHRRVTTIRECGVLDRLFADWALAYCGRASFVARRIEKALLSTIGGSDRDGGELLDIMIELMKK
jgi:hypothetical protein